MAILETKNRPFACDKCGTMHLLCTNHEGQVYGQKCKNWPCTSGMGQYTSMTYWGGPTEVYETTFYAKAGDTEKVRLERKILKAKPDCEASPGGSPNVEGRIEK